MAKQTKNRTNFTTIRVEGAILPIDLLQQIAKSEKGVKGLTSEDYHLSGETIKEAISRSWNRLRGAWTNFNSARAKIGSSDTGTSLTREKWLLPLFQELGYGRLMLAKKSIDIEDKSYAISHFWQQLPIHLVGCGVDLDRRSAGIAGAARTSPHSLVQELLNRAGDYLWAFLSNGLKLRILRDNVSLTRQAYVEFDLESMMQGDIYPDFVLLWLLCHESRVEAEKPTDYWLEKWSRTAQEQGTRFLEDLRKGVESAISLLGSGFLAHSSNTELKDKLRSGQLLAQDYYRQLLRLVYRLLFLFVAEDRELLLEPNAEQGIKDRYNKFYSTTKLRRLAGKVLGTKHFDLWQSLRLVMKKLGNGGCGELALPALGSFLFSSRALANLIDCELENRHFLNAIRALAYTEDGNSRRPIDYRNLRSEELGSVYESLLELHPQLNAAAATFALASASGNERKTTGSYYTPESLVQCLLDSALDPVLDEAAKQPNPEQAILNLKVCDPACGSGHFLVAAAHRMAKRLAAIRTGDEEPAPVAIQKALRDVIGHCIYGVDINEMAVELCKVALWMEAIDPGKPLSFLEHHIQCGNSLLGTTPALMAKGIPDEAFTPIEGDDKKEATAFKKRNQKEKQGQETLFSIPGFIDEEMVYEQVSQLMANLEQMGDSTIQAVRAKQTAYENILASKEYHQAKLVADAWCAAFVWKKTKDAPTPVTEEVFRHLKEDPSKVFMETLLEIGRLTEQYKFLHWHVAFPTVFQPSQASIPTNKQIGLDGGFDVVLGNPPWERIKIQEKEWFATCRPDIANATNASHRGKLINTLIKEDPALHEAFLDAIRQSEGESHFIRNSNRFPLCGRGDINTYSIFTETNRLILSPVGRVGCIVPSGIATDDTTKFFFQDLMESKSLVSLYDFENREKLFPDVAPVQKFCLLTLTNKYKQNNSVELIFCATSVNDLKNNNLAFTLNVEDLLLLNPNTQTCPVFRSKKDAELNKTIHKRIPILLKETEPIINSWKISFLRMFDMATDSASFQTREQLLAKGYSIKGNVFFDKDMQKQYLPLYEAKFIQQFEHRHGGYDEADENNMFRARAGTTTPTSEQRIQPHYQVLPRYWVMKTSVEERVNNWPHRWLIAFRDIVRPATDTRCSVFAIIPLSGVGHTAPIVKIDVPTIMQKISFVGCMNSLVLDYSARQRIGGTHLTYSYLKQFPVLNPNIFHNICSWEETISYGQWIQKRVLELTYTAWDLEAFAKDCGYDGPPFRWDEERRFLIRAELDAAYFHLYGIGRDDVDYIMETFPIVKRKDEKNYGEYRTKRVILEVYDAMAEAMRTGVAYQTIVDPPPADSSVAHLPRETVPTSAVVEIRGGIFPFRHRETVTEADKYQTCVPLYTLKAAAGSFSDSQAVEPDGWVEIETTRKLRAGMFVAQVVGHSMESMIPAGAYCLFASPVVGSRQGKIVLVEHHSIQDAETGGRYTLKRYQSTKETDEQGNWQHSEIRLEPLNPAFEPMVLKDVREDELKVVAEVIEVLS